MIRITLGLLVIIIIAGCGGNLETVETKDEFGNQIRFTRSKTDSLKQGAYLVLDATGQKMEEANYVDDQLHGERRLYGEGGVLDIVERYVDGAFDGLYQKFHPNGQVKFEASYITGILSGETKSYYESGQLKEIVAFKNNEENGPFEEYHPNGKIKAKGQYLDGDNEHGELELYDENGILIKKMNCEKGVCRTSWTKEEGEAPAKKI